MQFRNKNIDIPYFKFEYFDLFFTFQGIYTNIQIYPEKKKMVYHDINIEAQFNLEIKFYVRKEISSSGKL